ncbi:DNA-binding transcriptional regulator, GntR family [Tistlia consotensis]|uniref:DNA-binding transcriptional regulator, GntR family n=1 Tax=Tistlia consotensis USBA 355 TaxID=560819 RepID=A0A1Y6BLN6_9PROT|nr:GntR family transcriptional regulator [Tistlia consotensis]SMF07311.1 DNA-binding transcriptional regulator, GntR family [Tistlia consotensis USBA 355]SNR35957.1 DNA-binding transcriptional regulator, GntR family [Tistlia consotensis]
MRIEPRPVLIDEVYDRLKQAILAGELAAGAPLAQEPLAARLGVSRQPVSHALRLLLSEGLVTERGRRGLMVAPIEPDRLRDLYRVRAALDALAARLAAERAAGGAVVDLSACLSQGRAALADGELGRLIAADVAFHRAVYAASGNSAIAETAEAAWPHFQRSMGLVLGDPDYGARAWREHAAIAEAVGRGQAERAETLARAHAEQAGEATWRRLSAEVAPAAESASGPETDPETDNKAA